MNVETLRQLIANLPGDMPVLLPDADHGYMLAVAGVAKVAVLRDKTGHVVDRCEYYPAYDLEEYTQEPALVVSCG